MSDSDGADDSAASKETWSSKKTAASKPVPMVTVEEPQNLDPEDPPEPPDPFERLRLQEKPAAKEEKKTSERLENRNRTGQHTDRNTVLCCCVRDVGGCRHCFFTLSRSFNYVLFPADVVDLSEDGLRVVAGVVPRRPSSNKPSEKNPDTLRRIFSAHKKVSHCFH